MTRPRILRRPSAAAAARHPYGLCNLSSSFHKMTKIKQLSKSENNNNKMLPLTDEGSTINTSGTQQLKSTSAVTQQCNQKPTVNENQSTSQQLEPRLVNNQYFVLDGLLVNHREATEQQSLHTISVTLSFAQNLSSLLTCPSSSSSAVEFHFELVGQAVHIKWQYPPTENIEENNKAVTIGERATARIMCGSSKLLRYLKQSMPQLKISLCNSNGSKISKTIVPVGDRLAATDDDDCLCLLNEDDRVINVSGIYQLHHQQTTTTAAQIGVQILISKLGQLPREEEEEVVEDDSDPSDLIYATEEDDKDLQLFLQKSAIEELGTAVEKMKTAIEDAHQSELAFRREKERLIRLSKRVQLLYERKRIEQQDKRDKLAAAAAAAKVMADVRREKQRLAEEQRLDLKAKRQRQEKEARQLRYEQQQQFKKQSKNLRSTAADGKEGKDRKKKRRLLLGDDSRTAIITDAHVRGDANMKPKQDITTQGQGQRRKRMQINKKSNAIKRAFKSVSGKKSAVNGQVLKKGKHKRKTNQSPHLKLDEDSSSSESEEECCSAQPCLKPPGKKVKWVQCDGKCQLWFHYRCEGLLNNDVKDNKDYICRQCLVISDRRWKRC